MGKLKYDFNVDSVSKEPLEKVRAELLKVKGVGPESADAILLYAFGFTSFVIDAYTARLCRRYPLDADSNYNALKAYFEESLSKSAEVYNNFHALIVMNGKEHCRKKAVCDGCPLFDSCERCGL